MKYHVNVTEDAGNDILDIYSYIYSSDSKKKADSVYRFIKETCNSLEDFPEKGHFPPELERIGIKEFREVHFSRFRIIYQVMGENVYIHCVLDGRRELQELLERRLIR